MRNPAAWGPAIKAPTDSQLRCLRAIRARLARCQVPSYQELGQVLGCGRGAVAQRIARLADRGLVTHRPGRKGTLQLTRLGRAWADAGSVLLPRRCARCGTETYLRTYGVCVGCEGPIPVPPHVTGAEFVERLRALQGSESGGAEADRGPVPDRGPE